MRANCHNCGWEQEISASQAGSKIACPNCSTSMPVPTIQAALPQIVSDLGGETQSYGPSVGSMLDRLASGLAGILLGLVLMGGVLFIWLRPGGEFSVLTVFGLILGTPFLLLGLAFVGSLPWRARDRIYLCPLGFVQAGGGQIVSCLWDDIACLREGDWRRAPVISARRLEYQVLRKENNEPLVFVPVRQSAAFRRALREEAAMREIAWESVDFYPLAPLAKTCPRCGSPRFTRTTEIVAYVTPHNVVRSLRECSACGARYRAPLSAWAASAFVIVGCLVVGGGLIGAVAILCFKLEPIHLWIPAFITCILSGPVLLIFGLLKLRERRGLR
jgi:uncharacterized protein (DUF983 family)